ASCTVAPLMRAKMPAVVVQISPSVGTVGAEPCAILIRPLPTLRARVVPLAWFESVTVFETADPAPMDRALSKLKPPPEFRTSAPLVSLRGVIERYCPCGGIALMISPPDELVPAVLYSTTAFAPLMIVKLPLSWRTNVLSLTNLPVVPLNRARALAVAAAGPTTSPAAGNACHVLSPRQY